MATTDNNEPEEKKQELEQSGLNEDDLPIIAVMGATGSQGGAVLRALSKSGLYSVRGITRDPESDKAKAMAKANKNTSMVKGDSFDVESLKKAFQGCHGVFAVTFFWNHGDPAKETQETQNIADAAKACKVKHVALSTLEDTRVLIKAQGKDAMFPTLAGKYKVPHFDAKGETQKLLTASGVPTTFVLTTAYWTNFIYFGMGPQATDKPDEFAIVAPMKGKLLGMNMDTLGLTVLHIFKKGADKMKGQYVGIHDEAISYQEICDRISKKTGKTVKCNYVEPSVYAKFGFPGAADLANMFLYYDTFSAEFEKARNYAKLREFCEGQLPEKANGFDQFLQEMGDKIPFPQKK